jgi:protein ImuB
MRPVVTLAAAGITTFGEACALPRDALARRVGAQFVATLDRARGAIPDPRPPFVAPPRYEGRLELPAAVESVEALAFAVNRLVHELAGWLLGRGLGIVELSLALAHERHVAIRGAAPATAARFALAAPAREPAHLIAVLRERLARVALPAPVVAITLASEATAPLAGRNLGLLPGADASATVPLVDRLRARLGEDAVVRVRPHPEHRPERAWKLVKVGAPPNAAPGKPATKKPRPVPDPRTSAGAEALTAMADSPRPAWLLAEPEPLGHHLEALPWVLRDGPERIESGWWDGADVRRDYFIAESPRGERVWIYRDHRYGADDGEWFLHGFFA